MFFMIIITNVYSKFVISTSKGPHIHSAHIHTLDFAGIVISVALFFLLKVKSPPHWSMQIVLGTLAFIMSIAWLNIEANEVVAILDTFGLCFGIDTGEI